MKTFKEYRNINIDTIDEMSDVQLETYLRSLNEKQLDELEEGLWDLVKGAGKLAGKGVGKIKQRASPEGRADAAEKKAAKLEKKRKNMERIAVAREKIRKEKEALRKQRENMPPGRIKKMMDKLRKKVQKVNDAEEKVRDTYQADVVKDKPATANAGAP